ncbi:hypothetical protein HYW21_03060 [Candidatus Woesearchaeota archaeon]|nr:hypothetical protein [Candidatus Woesearchaeota archaeon]
MSFSSNSCLQGGGAPNSLVSSWVSSSIDTVGPCISRKP